MSATIFVVTIIGLVFVVSVPALIAEGGWNTTAFAAFLSVFTGVLVWAYMSDKPRAIDVYRGNTELEVTYVGGVAKDSVVVYKVKTVRE